MKSCVCVVLVSIVGGIIALTINVLILVSVFVALVKEEVVLPDWSVRRLGAAD